MNCKTKFILDQSINAQKHNHKHKPTWISELALTYNYELRYFTNTFINSNRELLIVSPKTLRKHRKNKPVSYLGTPS